MRNHGLDLSTIFQEMYMFKGLNGCLYRGPPQKSYPITWIIGFLVCKPIHAISWMFAFLINFANPNCTTPP